VNLGVNGKAIVTLVIAVVGALVTALGPGNESLADLSLQTWLVAAGTVLGSSGLVWFTQNGPWHPYIKTVVAFLSAGIPSLVAALDDGVVTQGELLTAFSVAVAATGLVFQTYGPAATTAAATYRGR
jgi:hypothetical protein